MFSDAETCLKALVLKEKRTKTAFCGQIMKNDWTHHDRDVSTWQKVSREKIQFGQNEFAAGWVYFAVGWVINDLHVHWQTTLPAVMEKSLSECWRFPRIITPLQQQFLKMHQLRDNIHDTWLTNLKTSLKYHLFTQYVTYVSDSAEVIIKTFKFLCRCAKEKKQLF